MTISFILNGEDVSLNARSYERLSDVIRSRFGLTGMKSDCRRGNCGKCLILLDGRLAPSCLLPVFRVRGREVVTIEGFSQTDEYQDIAKGFSEAHLETCGFCEAGKMLAAAALLERRARPTPEEILEEMSSVPCRCTDPDTLVRGVLAAADLRARRLYRRASQ
jgi:aerobic carbon-monoxide dehydrogenase small subunit